MRQGNNALEGLTGRHGPRSCHSFSDGTYLTSGMLAVLRRQSKLIPRPLRRCLDIDEKKERAFT